MTEQAMQLGYIGLEVSDFGRWTEFANDVLGLGVRVDERTGARLLRMDDNDRRIILQQGPADDLSFAGWLLPGAGELDNYAAHLRASGVTVGEGSKDEAVLRGVERFIHFKDPAGIRHEAFFGPSMGRERFVSPSVAGNFVTGDGGLGHIVIGTAAYKEAVEFAQKALGAQMSDIIRQPLGLAMAHISEKHPVLDVSFLHVNERHHSLAYADLPGPKKMHHFMVEVDRVDEVGRARDRALKGGFAVAQDIGQHPNDKMISIYVQTPSGFLVEFGWGGRLIKPDEDWRVVTYPALSEWGHRPAAPLSRA